MRANLRRLSVELLEERRLMAIVIAGKNYHPPGPGEEFSYVAPGVFGLAPIALPNGIVPPGATELTPPPGDDFPPEFRQPPWELPPGSGFDPIPIPAGIVPPGTTQLSSPPGGELPSGLSNFSGLAETNATALAVGWLYANDNAVGDISQGFYQNAYALGIVAHQGNDFFRYGVSEAADQVGASYVVRDGVHSEILSSREITTTPLISTSDPVTRNGGLVYAQFDNSVLTALAVHSEIDGADSVWTWDGSGPAPGLTLPGGYLALDALVQSHLSGPAAAAALDTFHFAADRYFELAGVGPVLADFNHDGQIDGGDYVVLRHNNKTAGDYNLWRRHYGETIAAGDVATVGGVVPEPTAIALLGIGGVGPLIFSRKRRERGRTFVASCHNVVYQPN